VSRCDGVNCGQPSLSQDGSLLVYVKEERPEWFYQGFTPEIATYVCQANLSDLNHAIASVCG
jgi:hypothetical protein